MMGEKRYSRQREAIYKALAETREHPTAEMIYAWLKPTQKNLSLGTVYRNLNNLAEEGLATKMQFPVERYDANTKNHPHFCCETCGAVYDIDMPYNEALDELASDSGHIVKEHELLFRGICRKCREHAKLDLERSM